MSNLQFHNTKVELTTNDLSQVPPIERAVDQANSVVDQAIRVRRDSLLQRLFPDATQKAIIAGELALVESEFEFRKQALLKIRETQLQSLTEVCNQYLVREKAQIRANTAQFLMQKALELQTETERIIDMFIALMDNKMQAIESIKTPRLKEAKEKQLERDIEGFMEQQQLLMDKFRRIISEELKLHQM